MRYLTRYLYACVPMVLFYTSAMALTCSTGYAPSPDSATCLQLCTAGATKLKSSNGVSAKLFTTRHSNPSLNVTFNGKTCYAHLLQGSDGGAQTVHTTFENDTYHTFPDVTPGIYTVQIGAYSNLTNARLHQRLAAKHGPAIIILDGTLWRVRIVNLTATTAKSVYNAVDADTSFNSGTTNHTPGLLKDGKWASITSI